MRASQAHSIGRQLASLVADDRIDEAGSLLAPLLGERIPFPALGRIGDMLGRQSLPIVDPFLDWIAKGRSEGGWVIIGAVLGQHLTADLEGSLARCRQYVVRGGTWYVADILGDRVPGPALLTHFDSALQLLDPWRTDEDRWVRRCVGVAIHFWAKRSKGAPENGYQAETLLAFLDPMFSEWEMDAVKGVGWGLKTLGKHYPETVAEWLRRQIGRRHRAVIVRKAMTYLPEHLRRTIMGQ